MIVITGGPGAGKTALLELARKEFTGDVDFLPEAASILFGGGFIRRDTVAAKKASQRAIYHVQRELEQMSIDEGQATVALCDRGTIDGLAYWPGSTTEFWKDVKSSFEEELLRYHAVIHLQTPRLDQGYNYQNPLRIESSDEARVIDLKILEAWEKHPRRYVIESQGNFLQKATRALEVIKKEMALL